MPLHLVCLLSLKRVMALQFTKVQIPTRIPEKFVAALFSGILVISGIVVVAGRQLTNYHYQVSQAHGIPLLARVKKLICDST